MTNWTVTGAGAIIKVEILIFNKNVIGEKMTRNVELDINNGICHQFRICIIYSRDECLWPIEAQWKWQHQIASIADRSKKWLAAKKKGRLNGQSFERSKIVWPEGAKERSLKGQQIQQQKGR